MIAEKKGQNKKYLYLLEKVEKLPLSCFLNMSVLYFLLKHLSSLFVKHFYISIFYIFYYTQLDLQRDCYVIYIPIVLVFFSSLERLGDLGNIWLRNLLSF